MSLNKDNVIEIRNFTTFMNDEMQTIIATDRKMHITETSERVSGVLAPMNDEGCFVVEVSVTPDRVPKEQSQNHPTGLCYRFISEDPIIAPGVDDFILFWISDDHACGVEVQIKA